MHIIKSIVPALIMGLALCGCKSDAPDVGVESESVITVGFSQLGAESDWRIAATESVQQSLSQKKGYSLIYDDGQQRQENQLLAVREFIDQSVDYIILDPITETGWDATLLEAHSAGIPVILIDRRVDISDDSLYSVWAGSDFLLEGQRACKWLRSYLSSISYKKKVNIVHVAGTAGSSAQLGRSKALRQAAKRYGWNILMTGDGDFVQAKGREVMEEALDTFGDKINVVYCENDSEAIGAIEAIEQRGKKAGADIASGEILVMSFDATRQGLLLTQNGKIAVNTECNPSHGPICADIIDRLSRGEDCEHEIYVEEQQFSAIDAVTEVSVRGERYPVTMVDEELIKSRTY